MQLWGIIMHQAHSTCPTGNGGSQAMQPFSSSWVLISFCSSHPSPQDKLDFLHLPVLDGNVTSDAAMSRLADDCCARILRGESMYIHWWVFQGCVAWQGLEHAPSDCHH